MLATILDFPYPTIALLTGHSLGGACLFALAHDYRIMNSSRGFFQLPAIDLGLSFPGVGILPRLKLGPKVAFGTAHFWDMPRLNDGTLDIQNAQALGAAGTTVTANYNSTLELDGSFTVANHLQTVLDAAQKTVSLGEVGAV